MASYPNPSPEAMFHMQYESVRRDEVVGVLLALLLGGFGAHHFYLGRTGWGIFYLCFFWTPFPWIVAFIECFFMPGRVRAYNALQAAGLSAALGLTVPSWASYPGWVAPGAYTPSPVTTTGMVFTPDPANAGALQACSSCGRANPGGSRFCSGCGTALA